MVNTHTTLGPLRRVILFIDARLPAIRTGLVLGRACGNPNTAVNSHDRLLPCFGCLIHLFAVDASQHSLFCDLFVRVSLIRHRYSPLQQLLQLLIHSLNQNACRPALPGWARAHHSGC